MKIISGIYDLYDIALIIYLKEGEIYEFFYSGNTNYFYTLYPYEDYK
jgi:hypothetical protein